MPTTFNWIYLGIPTTPTGQTIFIDPTEGNGLSENASQLVGLPAFGSQTAPLYTRISSATMNNIGGSATHLDTDNNLANDTFTTNIGNGPQTFVNDAMVFATVIIIYVDGTTASVPSVNIVQSTTGQLFLAPPSMTATASPALTAKPIQSLTVTAINDANRILLIDRQQIGWDDGFVDGTAGNDLINSP